MSNLNSDPSLVPWGDQVDEDIVRLGRWEELCGELRGVEELNGTLLIELSHETLAVPAGTRRANQLKADLGGLEGTTVAILRTGITGDPFRIREIPTPSR